jgi:hypothetical protein
MRKNLRILVTPVNPNVPNLCVNSLFVLKRAVRKALVLNVTHPRRRSRDAAGLHLVPSPGPPCAAGNAEKAPPNPYTTTTASCARRPTPKTTTRTSVTSGTSTTLTKIVRVVNKPIQSPRLIISWNFVFCCHAKIMSKLFSY